MLEVNNVSMQFGGRMLFKEVNLKFQKGNCYGVIGANGAGKTTFLKIISKQLEPTSGSVTFTENERLSVLKQDQNAYNEFSLVDTVMHGYQRLIDVMQEKEALYSKADFTDEDGIRVGELEMEFMEMDGYEAESNARSLLSSLGVDNSLHDSFMKDIEPKDRVKVLLAQALFGNPDILLLDEPTNNLDPLAVSWLENFLYNFENTVIIVSHDRYFLNKVCTRICDVDYGNISLYVGNYSFWYESSQLIQKQLKDSNAKKEQKIKELEEFIARFSANASKSKQATSRKKELEKISLDEIKASTRVYPFIDFKFEREIGNDVLNVEGLSLNGFFKDLSFTISKGDKVAFISDNTLGITHLFNILNGQEKSDAGSFKFGITIIKNYVEQDNAKYFKSKDLNLVEWLRPYSPDDHESYIRGFLGRMLFSNEEALKKVNVVSGGERVRLMLSKTMMSSSNLIMFDNPTNHLDLEAISALNKGMNNFKGVILFTSHDHELLNSVANRIIYFDNERMIDKRMTYDEFLDYFHKVK